MSASDTRERLILAAEHLFAQQGIQGVSLREINVAAGQRNTSASHYHFGSKDALVAAVLANRDGALRSARLARLEAIDIATEKDLPRAIIEAFVAPTADLMDESPDFLRFVAQLFLHPPVDWRALITSDDSALSRAVRMLRGRVEVPEALLIHRMILLLQHVSTTMAAYLRARETAGDDTLVMPREAFLANLVDCLTAFVTVPPSAQTREELPPPRPRPE